MSRLFGFLTLLIALGVGLYLYARQAQSSSAAAGVNNPRAAVDIVGVRSDLMTIAQAERGNFALEGKYVSLDELISSKSLSVARQRPPYTYTVETSSSSFRVLATRSSDGAPGTPTQLSVDENMIFQTSE
ncbi:MAG: hypothetical protein WCB05_06415 [Candidatus Sulfotelmatobacter sp.]